MHILRPWKENLAPTKEGMQAGPRTPRSIRLIWWPTQESLCEFLSSRSSESLYELAPGRSESGIVFGMLCSPSRVVWAPRPRRGSNPNSIFFWVLSLSIDCGFDIDVHREMKRAHLRLSLQLPCRHCRRNIPRYICTVPYAWPAQGPGFHLQ